MPTIGALAVVAGLWGCGGAQGPRYDWTGLDEATGQQVSHQPGAMPASQNFTGVYQSGQIGQIQLSQTGDSIVGVYEYDRGSCHVTARLEGNVTGNLFKFSWREDHRSCGRIAPVTGRGYFLYVISREGDIDRPRIFGRWGYREEEREGGAWTAYRLPNRQPTFQEGSSGEGGGESSGSTAGAGGSESSGGESSTAGGTGGASTSGSNSNSGLQGL